MSFVEQNNGEIDLDFLGTEDQPVEDMSEGEQEPQQDFGLEQAAAEEEEVQDEFGAIDEVQEPTMETMETLDTVQTTSTQSSSKSKSKKAVMTKSQLIAEVAKRSGASPKDIRTIMEAHQAVGAVSLHNTGSFKIHGLATLKTKMNPAKPERIGWNPFTKQHQTFKAKPASVKVKARTDPKVKKTLKPKEKVHTWNAKQKRQLEERINAMVIKKSMSKPQIIDHITHKSGLARHHVAAIFDHMGELCIRELAARGSFKVPDVANLTVKEKKALPEREGINPFTKERMTFKSRDATKVVKANIPKLLRSLAPAFIDTKTYASSSAASKPASVAEDTISLPVLPSFVTERG